MSCLAVPYTDLFKISEENLSSFHYNITYQSFSKMTYTGEKHPIKMCFISIPLVTSKWNDVRTSENIWHLDPLTGEALEQLMTTMTFCKRGDQLSMTSICGLCQVL